MKKLFTLFLGCLLGAAVSAQPGSVDGTYTTGTGFNSYVFASALQTDGKLVVVGAFTTFNGTSRSGVARLNTDGTLDMSFNPGTGFNNWVTGVKIQTDGKIITVGSYTSFNGTARNGIARLNADGTLDTSFDPGTGFTGAARNLDIQADGKPIVVGDFTAYNGTARNRIVRINTNGSIDTSYDPGTGFDGNAFSIKIQADGKALIGSRNIGPFSSYNGTPMNKLVRLNTDATLDMSFNIGTGLDNGIHAFELQSDNKIILVGAFTTYDGNAAPRIMRLNSDGTFDSSFNPGTGANSEIRNVAIQTDGSIFAVGLFTTFNGASANRVVKLTSNGSIDGNFNPGTAANNEINTIAIQSNNKVILGGHFTGFNVSSVTRIVRLNNCVNTTAIDYQTSCGDFTWIDGNTYTTNNNTATHTISNVGGCDSVITLNLNIITIDDQTLTAGSPSICDMGSTTISTSSSQNGMHYYLRDDSDDSVIDGPLAGTGSSLDFSTGSISTTTSYNVYAEAIENSLEFDGVDDEAVLGAPDFAGQSFTIEFWGKRNTISGGNDFFLGQGTVGTNTGLHIGFRASNQFTFAFFNNDLNTPVYTDIDWHHWAMTYDAATNERKIYRDGILVASDIATGDYIGNGDIYLGDLAWGGANIHGNLDEVRVWDSNKSMAEVQSLMNTCLVGDENGLMAYYKLNETSGTTTVEDSSPNAFDGTLVNMDENTAWQNGVMNCSCSAEMTDILTVTVNYSNTGVDYQSACESFVWIDGNTYTTSNTTATHTLTNMNGCDSVVTLNLFITTISDESVTPDQATFCDNGTATISTGSSADGFQYFLRDDSDDSVIDGPIAGDGSSLDFSTGSISATTSYNVYAENIEGSLDFDGADDVVQVSGIDISNSSFTIEFWSKRNSIGTNDYYVSQGPAVTNNGLHVGYRFNNEFTIAFFANDLSAAPFTDLGWHHYAITYDATTNARAIYRNGVLIASDVAPADYQGTGMMLFGDTSWDNDFVNGNMDELRIWDIARTEVEIQNSMNVCLSGDENNLIAYYKFNELAGETIAYDETSNGFDGTLLNFDVNAAWEDGAMSCSCSTEMTDVVTITINNSNTGTDVQTACDSYTWIDGNTYTADNNTAQFTVTNMAGCDSVVTLNLTIAASPIAGAVNNGDGTLSATGTGTYQWIDCGTNTAVSGATSATFIPTSNGDYAVVVTSGSCDDTSACVTYNSVGLAENGNSVFTAYPNPTTGLITINSNNAIINKIVVRDAAGRTIYETQNTSSTAAVDLSEMENGVYFITIFDADNAQTTMKVMKQ